MTAEGSVRSAPGPVAPARVLQAVAYLGILVAAPVYGFWRAILPIDTTALLVGQTAVLALFIVATFLLPPIRSLRGFFIVGIAMGVVPTLVAGLVIEIGRRIGLSDDTRYLASQVGAIIWKGIVCLAMVGLLVALGLKRREFFLARGDMDAFSKRERWLPGMKADETWMRSGRNITLVVFILGLVLLLGLNVPRLGVGNLVSVLPLLPAVLVFAAMNAFYEELTFRAAPMSQLEPAVGGLHTLLITSLFFGLGHFSGSVPDGFVGIAFAGYLALIMGKAMLETRGIAWPWIIHVVVDIPIFLLLAVAAQAAGTI